MILQLELTPLVPFTTDGASCGRVVQPFIACVHVKPTRAAHSMTCTSFSGTSVFTQGPAPKSLQ